MSDTVIVDGDLAIFQPTFGAATVVVPPGQITGSGPPTAGGSALCIDGDEGSVEVAGCLYMTPQYSIPGSGTVTIDSLADDQKAQKTTVGGTALILKGGSFTAKLQVQSPAQQPPPGPGSPIPDSTSEYSGSGSFTSFNTKLKAT
jgi:hypothetical protein